MSTRPSTSRSARRATSGSTARKPRKRLGCQTPRLFTPPLRPLTPETSLGFEVIEFADWMRDRLEQLDANRGPDDDNDYLGLLPRLLEWQRWLLVHSLELLPGPGAVFRFRTVLLLVGRQNGKSTLLTVLILWRLFQDGARMVLETHASLDHAKKAWEEAVEIAEAIPELADEIAKVNQGKGSELMRLDGGEKFKIASANRRGGRGFSGDFIIFDELRDHQDWKAWSATSKTTMARRRSQVWGVSSAGDSSSVVLRHLRKIALAAITGRPLEDMPADFDMEALDSIGLFEWSAGTTDGELDGPPRSVWDRDGWAEANPSMGYTELDERAVATAAAGDPEWEFRTEVLCQFITTMGLGPFPAGSWMATAEERVERDTSRPACYGIDQDSNTWMVNVAIAFWDVQGRVRVEIAARRPGPDWLIPWLLDERRVVKPDHVTFQTRGAPISAMLDEFVERAGIDVEPWEGATLGAYHTQFFNLLRDAVEEDRDPDEPLKITHQVDAQLDVAATTAAVKALGDGWAVDRKASPNDASPLVAAIAAVGLLLTHPEPEISVYETSELMIV